MAKVIRFPGTEVPDLELPKETTRGDVIRATLGASLDRLINEQNTPRIRDSIRTLITRGIAELVAVGEIPEGLTVAEVRQGGIELLVVSPLVEYAEGKKGRALLAGPFPVEDRDKAEAVLENLCNAGKGEGVEILTHDRRDAVLVEYGIKPGIPRDDLERLLPILSGREPLF